MTMKNIPITIGFAITAAGQFTFGIYTLVIVAKGGGKTEISCWKNHSSLHQIPAPLQFGLGSYTPTTNTPRCISRVYVSSAANPRDCMGRHLPHLWYVGAILSLTNQLVLTVHR